MKFIIYHFINKLIMKNVFILKSEKIEEYY